MYLTRGTASIDFLHSFLVRYIPPERFNQLISTISLEP